MTEAEKELIEAATKLATIVQRRMIHVMTSPYAFTEAESAEWTGAFGKVLDIQQRLRAADREVEERRCSAEPDR